MRQHGVGALGDHGDAAGAEHRADAAHGVDAERHVEDALAVPRVQRELRVGRVHRLLGAQDGRRRAAGDDAEHAAVAEDAAADVEDQLVERGADGQLDDARASSRGR